MELSTFISTKPALPIPEVALEIVLKSLTDRESALITIFPSSGDSSRILTSTTDFGDRSGL